MTHEPAAGETAAARSTNRVGADGTPLRGAPLHSAAPMPTAEAVTAATESAAALRAGVVVPPKKGALRRALASLKRGLGSSS